MHLLATCNETCLVVESIKIQGSEKGKIEQGVLKRDVDDDHDENIRTSI